LKEQPFIDILEIMSLVDIAKHSQAAWAGALFELKRKVGEDQDYFSDAIGEMKEMILELENFDASEGRREEKARRERE